MDSFQGEDPVVDRITLDRKAFKALASETRLDLLKSLDERRKTLSELSRERALHKATVLEHLEKLVEVGLVEKVEDERKWVYYQLTWKGRRILHPTEITIALLLSLAAGAGGVSLLAAFLRSSTPTPEGVPQAQLAPSPLAPSPPAEPILPTLSLVFALLTLALLVVAGSYFLWSRRRIPS